MRKNPFSDGVVLPRNKRWYFLLHKILRSFNSNSAKFGVVARFDNGVINFQTEQVSEKTPTPFYLANTQGRGENLKANMDGGSECQLFLPEKIIVLLEFALMLRYGIDTSLVRTLLPVFPIHTKSKYQFQEGQIVEYKCHSGDLELNV